MDNLPVEFALPIPTSLSQVSLFVFSRISSLDLTFFSFPSELRRIFQYIQRVVESRYQRLAATMRFTCISAFVFLRFFVPALLNPKLFGLTFSHPHPRCQRTLTLIAKTLLGLANMSHFDKEPFMAVMNGFLAENREAFIDFIANIATPVPDSRPQWTSPAYALYEEPLARRARLTSLDRDRVPTLPHLFDEAKDLAAFASLVSCGARSRGSSVASSMPPQSLSSERAARLERLVAICTSLNARSTDSLRGSGSHAPTPPPRRSSTPHVYHASSRTHRLSASDDANVSVDPSPSKFPINSLKLVSPRSKRAQSVSATENLPPTFEDDQVSKTAQAQTPTTVMPPLQIVRTVSDTQIHRSQPRSGLDYRSNLPTTIEADKYAEGKVAVENSAATLPISTLSGQTADILPSDSPSAKTGRRRLFGLR